MRPLCAAALLVFLAVLPGCFAMRYVPAGAGVAGPCPPQVEVVRFPSTGGLTLEGRMYPPECERPQPPGTRSTSLRLPEEYARTVILHCHGVADNNCSAMACFFTEAGFRVFQFDYRGFGHSDTAGFSNVGFAEDAAAALRYLRTRSDVDPDRIIIYGHSMGGAYALAAAATARADGRPVRAVVTANAFSHWRLVANHHLPIVGFLLGGVPGPEPADWARRLGDTPYLVVHVQDDRDVPVDSAPRLYGAAVAGGSPASLHIHPDGGHAFPFWTSIEENGLERVVVDFARTWLAERAPPTPRQRADLLKKNGWSVKIRSSEFERQSTLEQRVVIPAIDRIMREAPEPIPAPGTEPK
jgi:uncharacterized protein